MLKFLGKGRPCTWGSLPSLRKAAALSSPPHWCLSCLLSNPSGFPVVCPTAKIILATEVFFSSLIYNLQACPVPCGNEEQFIPTPFAATFYIIEDCYRVSPDFQTRQTQFFQENFAPSKLSFAGL